jgi:hypothetical protein
MTEDFELIVKWFITVTGLISVIVKFADSISESRRKRNLKTDLELLEKIDKGDLDSDDQEKIKKQIKEILEEYLSIKDTTVKWYDMFYALALFVGFGWWTIYIYEMNKDFNPWTILTGLISFIGLALLIDNKWRKKSEEKTLLTITVLKDIRIAAVFLGLGTLLGFFIFIKFDGYTHWYILIGVMIPIGLKTLFDSIKIR